MDREIFGEIFEYNNKKYIVKESIGCTHCAFYNLIDCLLPNNIRGCCDDTNRSDGKSIIFIECKEEKIMENLLNCKGKRFKCKIEGDYVEGKIQVEEGRVYLCQNIKNGGVCTDQLGYTYSWYVETGSESHLSRNYVTNFRLIDMTKEEIENYKNWQVGDKIIHKNGTKGEIIFRSGELVVYKYTERRMTNSASLNSASPNFTVNELHRIGWRLDETPIEESFVEMTMEEIAKLKGIPVEKLRIKDK